MSIHSQRPPRLSVCIPAYNRPDELQEVLESIAGQGCGDWDVVVCEDHSPRAEEIEAVVVAFCARHPWLRVDFSRNATNLGYDGNLRRLIERATGVYVMFVGDDDILAVDSLVRTAEATRGRDLGVVLRAWTSSDKTSGRTIEEFRYFRDDRVFPASHQSAAALFRRAIFISGLTVHRKAALALSTSQIDGTLLYQLYLVARLASTNDSYYISVPTVTRRVGGEHFFGSSEVERGRFAPKQLTEQHSLTFVRGIFHVATFASRAMPDGQAFRDLVMQDFARYSYPMLEIQARRVSRLRFARYFRELARTGLGGSTYFWAYCVALLGFGPSACSWALRSAKRVLGRTPNLGGASGVTVPRRP